MARGSPRPMRGEFGAASEPHPLPPVEARTGPESPVTEGCGRQPHPVRRTPMPPIDFRTLSLQDALDLALSIEEEAKERYEQFAKITGGRYAGDAADMCRQMAAYEARHWAEIDRKRRELFGDAPRRITPEAIDDVEAPDRGAPRTFMSARQE